MAKVEEPTALVNPPESVMDRIHFVINNVTVSNLTSKVRRNTNSGASDGEYQMLRISIVLFDFLPGTTPVVPLYRSAVFPFSKAFAVLPIIYRT